MNTIDTQQVLIAHPTSSEQIETIKAFFKALKIKFEVAKENPYNPEFVAKIKQSDKQYKEGKFTRVKAEDLDKFIDNL